MKRAIDLVVAATLLVVTAPLLVAIAAVVRIVDGPPVLFRQARSGRGGRPFELVKFRTMRPAGPDDAGPQHDAERLTRVGRVLRSTSLDELPTLVHVVRGEMALVGPRPLPVSYLHRYDDTQARRLEVRPGITGWAQVHGRNTTAMGRTAGPRRLVRRPRARSPSTPASSPAPSEWSCGGDGIDQRRASR